MTAFYYYKVSQYKDGTFWFLFQVIKRAIHIQCLHFLTACAFSSEDFFSISPTATSLQATKAKDEFSVFTEFQPPILHLCRTTNISIEFWSPGLPKETKNKKQQIKHYCNSILLPSISHPWTSDKNHGLPISFFTDTQYGSTFIGSTLKIHFNLWVLDNMKGLLLLYWVQ